MGQDGIKHGLSLPHLSTQPQLSTRAQEHTARGARGGGVKGWRVMELPCIGLISSPIGLHTDLDACIMV